MSGLTIVTCSKPNSKKCTLRGESDDTKVQSSKESCTNGGGEVVEHCPTEGLGGCCLLSGAGDCFYDPAVVATIMSGCAASGGMWSSTPP